MLNQKSLLWFLSLTVLLSWPLFLLPLAFEALEPATKSLVPQGLWAAAMWAPGISAILVTVGIERKPFHSLRLNTLGPKRFYLWAWFLPAALTILSGLFTLGFGAAEADLSFTALREAMEAVNTGGQIPVVWVVVLQMLFAILLAPWINILFAVGEETGWRGFLLPQLLPLGQWKAALISGAIWGLWHAPVILQGHNYPGYPIAGIFMMVMLCILLGTILSWLYLNTHSPWVAALAHGSINATAGLSLLFFKPGYNIAFSGTLAAPTAWIGMAAFIAWLAWTKRFPVTEIKSPLKEGGDIL